LEAAQCGSTGPNCVRRSTILPNARKDVQARAFEMDDSKDPSAFAGISTTAKRARNVMLSGYIRCIARAIIVLARKPVPAKRANMLPGRIKNDDGKTLSPSRRINDLIWKRTSSRAS
jgi:hypothetical protein